MNKLTNHEFISFLNSFKSNDEYYTTVSEISKPIYIEKGVEKKGYPLIESVNFKMFSLDEIKHDTQSFNKNFPKSTDAIFYKLDNDQLTLYLIEFKGHNLNKPNRKSKITALKRNIEYRKKQCNRKVDGSQCYTTQMITDLELVEKEYGDTIEFGLKEKPTETLFITIPSIYKEYCKKQKIEIKDIDSFLKECEIRLFVFAAVYDDFNREEKKEVKRVGQRIIIDQKPKGKNKRRSHGKYNKSRTYVRTMGDNLNQHYKKLRTAGLIDYYKIKNKHQFRTFLQEEHLKELENT